MSNFWSKKGKRKKGTSLLEQELKKQSIVHDMFDQIYFDGLAEKNAILKEKTEEGLKIWPQFKELQMDVFNALFKFYPRVVPAAAMEQEFVVNQMVMEMILNHPKYDELRMVTKMDKLNSIIGTEILSDELIKILKDLQDQNSDAMDQMKQAMQQMQQQQGQKGEGEGQAQGAGQEGDEEGDEEADGRHELTLEEAQKLLEEKRGDLGKVMDKLINEGLETGYNKLVNKQSKLTDFIHEWGFENNLFFQKKPYKEKLKLMQKVERSSKLKRIGDMLGRQREIAAKKKKLRVKHAETTLSDMDLGAELSRVSSTELALLKHPKTKALFFQKFADHALVQYKYGGIESLGYGPMVVCIDSSGSMDGAAEIWSKAVALALLEIANRQRRSYHAIHFDAGRWDRLKTHSFIASKKGVNPDRVIDLAQYFSGGGTSFEDPLTAAKKKIDGDENFERADIVFITDGHCGVSDNFVNEFNRWKNDRKVQLYSILIDMGGWGASKASLELFSNEIVTLNSLDGDFADKVSEGLYGHIQQNDNET